MAKCVINGDRDVTTQYLKLEIGKLMCLFIVNIP